MNLKNFNLYNEKNFNVWISYNLISDNIKDIAVKQSEFNSNNDKLNDF